MAVNAAPSLRLPKFRIHQAIQQAYVELSGKRICLGYHAALLWSAVQRGRFG